MKFDENRENAINQIRHNARKLVLEVCKELRGYADERDYYNLDKSNAERIRAIARKLDLGTTALWF